MSGTDDRAMMAAEIARLRAANADLTRALMQMEDMALRDPLTGLANRRYFSSALAERIARVARYDERIALVIVDVDGLKAINDRHGHGAGDAVLTAIGTHLRSETRETDSAARIGGDEFALLIDHVDLPAAEAKAAALRDSLAQVRCPHGNATLPLSATFGVSMIAAGDSADQLLHRADSAMYRAKRADSDIAGPPPGA
jgi:diguanylate cyclase (GGDEF)-like protein